MRLSAMWIYATFPDLLAKMHILHIILKFPIHAYTYYMDVCMCVYM